MGELGRHRRDGKGEREALPSRRHLSVPRLVYLRAFNRCRWNNTLGLYGPACSPRRPRRSCRLKRLIDQARLRGHRAALQEQHGCSSAMDQDLAQVDVAALADAEQGRLASVEDCRGTMPSQAKNSRPLRNTAPCRSQQQQP